MKYNLIQLKDGKFLEKICSAVELKDAINSIVKEHQFQSTDMFQDVSPINYDELDLHSFVRVKNGITYQYQIEVDLFSSMGEKIKPVHFKICNN